MKTAFILLGVLAFCTSYAQNNKLKGVIIPKDSVRFGSIGVELKNDSLKYITHTDSAREFEFEHIKPGYYLLVLEDMRDVYVDSFTITVDTTLKIEISYPLPCQFKYVDGKKPACFRGHTDHIIPIVYGFPAPGIAQEVLDGKVRLAGCDVTDCDPKYYCTIHKREL